MSKQQRETDIRRAAFDPLGDRLHREAVVSRPEFSESLHGRIVRAIDERRAEESQAHLRTPASLGRQHGFAALLTAACLLCAVTIGWRIYDGRVAAVRRAAVERYVDKLASQVASQWLRGDLFAEEEMADQASASFNDLVSSAGLSPRSGPLADNARAAADTLLRRLPIDVKVAQSDAPRSDRFEE